MTPRNPLLLLAAVAVCVLALARLRTPARAETSPPAAPPSTIRAEGRLEAEPGAHVVVGTEAPGTLVRLTIKDRQAVKKGELLAELRSDEQRAALLEMEAQHRSAEADEKQAAAEQRAALASAKLADVQLERARNLVARETMPQETLDRAERDQEDARARFEQCGAHIAAARARARAAAAGAKRLQAVLDRARILSPIDGVVLDHQAEEGETVAAGAPIVTIADLGRTRIAAEVDEFDAPSLHEGAEVAVSVEGLPGRSFRGRVSEIPDEVVPRRVKPEDPGRPSDTRVVRAKVVLLEPAPLRLGQRVELSIHR